MIILKHNLKTHFSPLYFIDGDEPFPVGFLATEGIELMKEKKELVHIDQVEIIDKYFKNISLIRDVNKSEYYQLTPIK